MRRKKIKNLAGRGGREMADSVMVSTHKGDTQKCYGSDRRNWAKMGLF